MRPLLAPVLLMPLLAACLAPTTVRPVFDPARSTVTVSPATGLLADGHAQATITVTLLSSSGVPVSNVPVLLAASGLRNFFDQPVVTNAHGVTTGTLTSTAAGVKTITASVAAVAISAMPTVQFVAGTGTQLVFQTEPANVAAGARMAAPVQVALEDAEGNLVPTDTSVTLTVVGATGLVLSETMPVPAAAGLASFPDLSIATAGTGYTLRAYGGELPVITSTPFNVLPAAEAKLVFAVQPSNVLAGASITPGVEVLVEDAFGNVVASAVDAVSLAIATGPTGASLRGTTTQAAASGEVTFGELSITAAGSGYALTASAPGLQAATSSSFVVSPVARSQLVFVVQPSAAQAGSAIAPPVQIAFEDPFGNIVSTADDITLALASGPAGATLTGTSTVSAAAGVGSFGALVVNRPGTYALGATAGSLTATSTSFTISSGPPARAAFLVQPSNATAGAAIAPPVQVALLDALGNLIPDPRAVSIAIGTHAATGVLAGTTTETAVDGLATFGDLSINVADPDYTLTATASGYAGATSLPFDIAAGPPATGTCLLTALPPTLTADGTSQTQLTVTARDAQGNVVSGASVTLAVTGSDNMLGLTGGTANVNGVFTTSLASTKAETKQITATIGGLATATTTVQFVASAPSRMSSSLVAMPTTVAVDSAVATLLVTIADDNGNPVNNATVTFSATGNGNTFTPSMGSTGPDGTMSATLLSTTVQMESVTALVGSFTLTTVVYFTSGVSSTNTSTVTALPPSLKADGVSTTQALVTVEDVHGNVVAGQPVTVAVSGSGNTLSSTGGSTDENGHFAITISSTEAGTKTITANVGPGNVTTQVVFTACPIDFCADGGYSTGTFCAGATTITCGASGVCDQQIASDACTNGCSDGGCNPPCTSNYCQDNGYASGSYCGDTSTLDSCAFALGCDVVSATTSCPNGCDGGACIPCPSNNCQDNGYSSGSYCDGSTQYSCGVSGACDVVTSSSSCGNGCSGGMCTCPSNNCQDNGYSSGSYCDGSTQYSCGVSGACDVVTSSSSCGNGCSGGMCTPCPSNYCQDNGHSGGSYCDGSSIISCGTSGVCNVVTGSSTCNATCSAGSCTCIYGNGLYCAGNGVSGNGGTLYQCTNGSVSVNAVCGVSCVFEPAGTNDRCATTCPSGNGNYCGDDEINGNANTLYSCVNGNISAIQGCAAGCLHEPPGINDKCAP